MDLLRSVFLILHFIGLAALLGGFLVQIKALRRREARILPAMVHGALTMLVSGLALVGIAEAGGGDLNHVKITVKSLVLVAIVVLVFVFRRRAKAPAWALWLIGGLTTLNVVLAVAW